MQGQHIVSDHGHITEEREQNGKDDFLGGKSLQAPDHIMVVIFFQGVVKDKKRNGKENDTEQGWKMAQNFSIHIQESGLKTLTKRPLMDKLTIRRGESCIRMSEQVNQGRHFLLGNLLPAFFHHFDLMPTIQSVPFGKIEFIPGPVHIRHDKP